jgi:hypothetical protein
VDVSSDTHQAGQEDFFRPRMRQGLAVVVAPISRLGMNTRRRKLHCRCQFTPTRTSPERQGTYAICVEWSTLTAPAARAALFQRRLLRKRRGFHRGIWLLSFTDLHVSSMERSLPGRSTVHVPRSSNLSFRTGDFLWTIRMIFFSKIIRRIDPSNFLG